MRPMVFKIATLAPDLERRFLQGGLINYFCGAPLVLGAPLTLDLGSQVATGVPTSSRALTRPMGPR